MKNELSILDRGIIWELQKRGVGIIPKEEVEKRINEKQKKDKKR